jgi:hypothetical protein
MAEIWDPQPSRQFLKKCIFKSCITIEDLLGSLNHLDLKRFRRKATLDAVPDDNFP